MSPTILQIIILGLVQGAAELLPVSSSAHVIVAEKFMGLDPSDPRMTFLLVMLHTGTMFAVIAYFWSAWRRTYFSSRTQFVAMVKNVFVATAATGIVGFALKVLIEKEFLGGGSKAEIEQLFSSLPLIAGALIAAGVVILIAAALARQDTGQTEIGTRAAGWIGVIQGVCLPFRGFSRSGSTISVAMLAGIGRRSAEEFSFALAVVITPIAIAREFGRLLKLHAHGGASIDYVAMLTPGAIGLVASFVAGLGALRWLSRWLEGGKWQYFGFYCLAAGGVIFVLSLTVLA